MALRSDDGHVPAPVVKETEGEACPPVPRADCVWGLLLSSAPRTTGQTLDHNSHNALLSNWGSLLFFAPISSTLNTHFFPSLTLYCYYYLMSPFQSRGALHYSEDEDAVIVGSSDFCTDYIDDCPWVSVTQPKFQGDRGRPDGVTNHKETVCDGWKYFFLSFSTLCHL